MNEPSKTTRVLSSDWMASSPTSGLSPHLIASFYEVRRAGQGRDGYWERVNDAPIVKAPLTEANLEMVLNWQSPFEQAGLESKAPTLMAMLQSGALQTILDVLNPHKSDEQAAKNAQAVNTSPGTLGRFEGRTGITKLNSTQVFNGMPPVKITVTALFRAWTDPAREVEAPFEQLMQWALPVYLDADSTLLSRAVEWVGDRRDWVEVLVPSQSPVKVAMQYKGRCYSPLVIESIGMPLNSPVDASGRFVQLAVPMTLCSLTAIDRADWIKTQRLEL